MKEQTIEKTKNLQKIILQINKTAGENVIGYASNMPNLSLERISTGITILDEQMGGGFPRGRIIEMYGQPGSGKSLISLLTIAEAQKQGLSCVYLDCEDAFDPLWAKTLGVDTDKLILSQSSVGEDTLELVVKLLEGKPAVIVIDSIGAMITRGELEEESLQKAFMAPKARLLSKALSIINAKNKETCLIFINQLRSTLAMYGPHFTTPGGLALKFYSSVRLEIKRLQDINLDDKKTKDVIGQIIGFRVTKNRTAQPFKKGSFKFLYTGKIE